MPAFIFLYHCHSCSTGNYQQVFFYLFWQCCHLFISSDAEQPLPISSFFYWHTLVAVIPVFTDDNRNSAVSKLAMSQRGRNNTLNTRSLFTSIPPQIPDMQYCRVTTWTRAQSHNLQQWLNTQREWKKQKMTAHCLEVTAGSQCFRLLQMGRLLPF